MLSSTVLNVVMLNVIMLNVVAPKCDTQNNTMLRTSMLSVVCCESIRLIVITMNVIMLIVVLPIALYGGPLS